MSEQEACTDEKLYIRIGDLEVMYKGEEFEEAWQNAKAGVDAYLEASGDE